MEMITEIPVKKIARSRIQEVDFENLEFGQHLSDHMLICDYANGQWQQPQILNTGFLKVHKVLYQVLKYLQADQVQNEQQMF